jgi:hypothetical protein
MHLLREWGNGIRSSAFSIVIIIIKYTVVQSDSSIEIKIPAATNAASAPQRSAAQIGAALMRHTYMTCHFKYS